MDFDLTDYMEGQKLKFFHYWFFQYVNNSNFRFYKQLLGKKASFSCLFASVLNFLVKVAKKQRA